MAGGSPTGRIGPAKYNSARVILLFMNRLLKFAQKLDLQGTGKWLLLSAAVGIVAGLGAIAFQGLLQVVQHFGLALLAGYTPPEAAGERALFAEPATTLVPWMIVPIMAIGGLISGWLVYTFAPEAEGHGTDAAIDAFHNKRGQVRPVVPLVKAVASAVTLGTGGSGGREGPIAQIGAGVGSQRPLRRPRACRVYCLRRG